jgi:hypothetical protein
MTESKYVGRKAKMGRMEMPVVVVKDHGMMDRAGIGKARCLRVKDLGDPENECDVFLEDTLLQFEDGKK